VSHGEHEGTSVAERITELSEEVLKSAKSAQQTAIEAVRKFVDAVDQALPSHGEAPSKREEITDSALEMAERLVHTQSDFLRKVVDSAGKSLARSDDGEYEHADRERLTSLRRTERASPACRSGRRDGLGRAGCWRQPASYGRLRP
jgi:uncharacterized protein with PhoU and TrkA domain